jgi:hypothetical protein
MAKPTNPDNSKRFLQGVFRNARKGYDIKSLYDFRIPGFEIQPAAVPVDFTFDRESYESELTRDNYVLEAKEREKIKKYIKESRETGNTGKALNVTLDDDEDVDEKDILARAQKFKVNTELYDAVKDADNDRLTSGKNSGIGNAPIYLVVLAGIPGGHASILFYVNGKIYSVGLGYKGGKESRVKDVQARILGGQMIANAFLYSPDYLITPWDGKRTNAAGNLVPFRYTIADIGILKQKHLDRIQSFLNGSNPEFTIGLQPVDGVIKAGKTNYKFKTYYINLNKQYNMISKSAKDKKDNINCTTFVETIFYERVECPLTIAGVPISVVSKPESCKSRTLTDPVATFKTYMMRIIERDATIDDLYDPLTKEIDDKGSVLNTLYDCTLGICWPRKRGGAKTRKQKKKARKTRKH